MCKKITSLNAQKRNPEHVNVFLDGEFAFGLSRIVAAWLTVGQDLSAEEVAALVEKDNYEKAYQKALLLLNYRSRSENEMRQKLGKSDFEGAVIEETINRLKLNNLVGDEQFAQNWVENRTTFRPRSRRMLTSEMRQKGIEKNIIEKVIENAPSDLELAERLLRKKFKKFQNLEWQSFRKKTVEYLLRWGFHYSVAQVVVERIWLDKGSITDVPSCFELEEKEK